MKQFLFWEPSHNTLTHNSDVVIISALHSAITKALTPSSFEDITIRNVLPPGGGTSAAYMATLYARIPNTTTPRVYPVVVVKLIYLTELCRCHSQDCWYLNYQGWNWCYCQVLLS